MNIWVASEKVLALDPWVFFIRDVAPGKPFKHHRGGGNIHPANVQKNPITHIVIFEFGVLFLLAPDFRLVDGNF